MDQPPAAVKIAIIGGGIGGIALAIGLLQYPHIDVQVYEANASFGDVGTAVGLGLNALKALELLDPSGRARAAVDTAGGKRHKPSVRMIMGKGKHAGTHLLDIDPEGTSQISVSRSRLFSSLIALVPSHRLHTRKRLRRIERPDGYAIPGISIYSADCGPLQVYFADGTKIDADAVIGADKIRGITRLQLLGQNNRAAAPRYAGQVAWRCVVPLDALRAKLPEELVEIESDLCMVGENGLLLCDQVEGGKMVNLVAVEFRNEWENEMWAERGDWKVLSSIFKDWGPAARGVIELMKPHQIQAFAVQDQPHAPTFAKSRVCLMGDAAHAATPWLGAGAGQALEDALMLTTVLGETSTPHDITTAFRTFDSSRRPRTQKLVDLSRETGETFRRADVNGIEELREKLGSRWDQVWLHDVEGDQKKALELMRSMRGGQKGRHSVVVRPHGQGSY